MEVKITKEVEEVLNNLGKQKKAAYKIYAGLAQMHRRRNVDGYFACPATYLQSINRRYYKIVDKLIEKGLLIYYKRHKEDGTSTKYYDINKGICMKYKFLFDYNGGYTVDVNMRPSVKRRWYEIIENSLKETGHEVRIIRDNFGRRVHHSAIRDYKETFSKCGYCTIDAVTSQPRLLFHIAKKRGIQDDNYFDAFENHQDFYLYISKSLKLYDRDAAKHLFMHWLNGKGYVPNYTIHNLFPEMSRFIKSLKHKSYKDAAAYLQREEAKIWIDDLLENLPVNFALPVYDSFVIKQKDSDTVLEYCKDKYPELKFDITYL